MEDCEGLKALSFVALLEAGKEKEESLALEEGNGEELESGREWIRVAEIEETAMELNTLCVTDSFSCVCSGLLEGGEEQSFCFSYSPLPRIIQNVFQFCFNKNIVLPSFWVGLPNRSAGLPIFLFFFLLKVFLFFIFPRSRDT